MSIKSIQSFDLKNQSVFIRVDFNVPIQDGVVTDANRIEEALPTIKYAQSKGAKVVLGSHLGRPDGTPNPQYSLLPVAEKLGELLNCEITLADDCIGDGIELSIKNLKNGAILLLENLRFHAGEEKNDPDFAQDLSKLCSIYINDAFGTAHRKHASTYGIPSKIDKKGMGFLIEKELKYLEPLVKNPAAPFMAVLGGSKVSDKIKTITALMEHTHTLCIGGAMAHAFWKVKNIPIPEGAKQPAPADVEAAANILHKAQNKRIQILIPEDTVLGFDIGPKTVETFSKVLSTAKTIFWNGPLGWFEKPEYAHGTFELAKRLAEVEAIKIVGGGDTVSAIKQSGYASKFQHLSTGGGAVLEYIENGSLPGIDILKFDAKRSDQTEKFSRVSIIKN